MLASYSDGKTVCLIEKYLGKKWKPDICKQYPYIAGETKCFNEKDNQK